MPLRVAAISFLNPAPLLYDFEHDPAAAQLRHRYSLHYTSPSQCAQQLLDGTADLGLIPIAALTPQLVIVPGCTIASRERVRSILLLVKNPHSLPRDEALRRVRSIAADTASRSSVAYAKVLFHHFLAKIPAFADEPADPVVMLAAHDAALLIGDPALLAREHRVAIESRVKASSNAPLLWLDVAELWREYTGLPWVAAVWALRPEALAREHLSAAQLIADLNTSREHGCANVEQLVEEWLPRVDLPAATIRAYLTTNIHYALDEPCLAAIARFRALAADIGALQPLPNLSLLEP